MRYWKSNYTGQINPAPADWEPSFGGWVEVTKEEYERQVNKWFFWLALPFLSAGESWRELCSCLAWTLRHFTWMKRMNNPLFLLPYCFNTLKREIAGSLDFVKNLTKCYKKRGALKLPKASKAWWEFSFGAPPGAPSSRSLRAAHWHKSSRPQSNGLSFAGRTVALSVSPTWLKSPFSVSVCLSL